MDSLAMLSNAGDEVIFKEFMEAPDIIPVYNQCKSNLITLLIERINSETCCTRKTRNFLLSKLPFNGNISRIVLICNDEVFDQYDEAIVEWLSLCKKSISYK